MDFEYLKLDMAHPEYESVLKALGEHFHKEFPDNVLSVNASKDGSVAWVKCCAGHGVKSGAILDSADYGTRQKVAADTTKASWE